MKPVLQWTVLMAVTSHSTVAKVGETDDLQYSDDYYTFIEGQ
jgi:hypothetical protein